MLSKKTQDIISGKSVLAVDDNPENLAIIETMLTRFGLRVRIARSGKQALASAASEPPDLILLDVHMPGMDGYETCRALKGDPQLSVIPILFVSALSDPFNKAQAYDLGALDYLEKPLKLEDVTQRVRNALLLSHYMRRCAELELLCSTTPDSGDRE